MNMNPAIWLVNTAREKPGHPALFSGTDLVCDYREFARRSAAIAHSLITKYDIEKGDRIAVFSKNCVEYLEALYGIWFCGAVALPINAKLHSKEAAWIIENAESKLCFTSRELGAALKEDLHSSSLDLIEFGSADNAAMKSGESLASPVSLTPDDMIWLFYTSGTTGKPKGAMITCKNVHTMVEAYFESVDDVYENDTIFYAAPISHGAGIYNFQHVLKGARHSVPKSGGFDPKEIFTAASKLGNLHMFAAPTMVKRLVEAAKGIVDSGHGIRTIVYGGGPMYLADILEAVDVMGDRFCQIYGQGESPMCITSLSRKDVSDRDHPRWKERLSSVGKAQYNTEVAIADKSGNPLEMGEIGEILVRGDSVMKGYWNNQEATDQALKAGWLWTGDMGSLDEDGYLTLMDRSKDLIISGGSNIYPREVEEALLAHGDVSEVSVVGEHHPDWGEIVVAFIKLKNGASPDESALDVHCLDMIARFKRPKKYYFVDDLPKNNYGKVLKTALREKIAQ